MVPVTLFFLVSFQLLALTQALMLREYGIRVSVFLAVMLGAMVVAKVVAVADHLPLLDRG